MWFYGRLYKKIEEEKRRRKAAERKLEEVKYENIALRSEVSKQISARIEEKRKMKKITAVAAGACAVFHVLKAIIKK